ncbi:hypothetical protein GEO11_02635 [Escherichia coli]|nr:hypothetical protein [Escherichia coli]
MAFAAKTAFGQFADGDGLRLSGGRLSQTLILVKTVEQSHINPEQYYLTIHYYFRIYQVILNHH